MESDHAPGDPLQDLPADHPVPWAMQIAVRYDKVHPARRVDVAEAAARAVVQLLASPQAAPGGPWHEAVDHWRAGRIRKIVRRARGKRWEEVQELDGVTVIQDGPRGWGQAAARALVPGPVRPLPAALAKTQVEGTHFPDGAEPPPSPARARGPQGEASGFELGAESMSAGALVTVEVTPLHEMTSGKLVAQCAHAAQLAWEHPDMPEQLRGQWADQGYRVRVVHPERRQWEEVRRPVEVTDAGFTEFGGPTRTTRACWSFAPIIAPR